MKVLVDNMLVNLKEEIDHVEGLDEMFKILCKYNMRLYLQKCFFKISLDYFKVYIECPRDEANHGKIQTIRDMNEPMTSKI